jgi:hypothetical protein
MCNVEGIAKWSGIGMTLLYFYRSLGLAMLGLSAVHARAEEPATPTGTIVLTVRGDISSTINKESMQFDLAMLKALPVTSFETSTIWTNGVHVFDGVSIADLAAELGVSSGEIIARSINDYAVTFPLKDAVNDGAIIAYLIDGNEMPIRELGPLWVVYDFDNNAAYRSAVTFARSIWQLDRLEFNQDVAE